MSWRRCTDCKKGFQSYTKVDDHRREVHPLTVTLEILAECRNNLARAEAEVRWYEGAKQALQMPHLPPGAREYLARMVRLYEKPFVSYPTKVEWLLDWDIPMRQKAIHGLEVKAAVLHGWRLLEGSSHA